MRRKETNRWDPLELSPPVCFFPSAASSSARSFRGSCSGSSSPPGPKALTNRSPASKEDAISSRNSGQVTPNPDFRPPSAGSISELRGGTRRAKRAGTPRGAVWDGGGTPPGRRSGSVSAAGRALGRDMATCAARRALAVGSHWWSRSLTGARWPRPLCAAAGAGAFSPAATTTTRRHLSSR